MGKRYLNYKIPAAASVCAALLAGIAGFASGEEAGSGDFPSFGEEEYGDALYSGAEEPATGTYQIPGGWEVKSRVDAGFGEVCVLRESSHFSEDVASEITCSYQSMLYSSLDYEQLRELLTNDVIYQNMNASISTSCLYTNNQDNLFLITADDAAQPYRDIYYYVTGVEKYFCVKVREYRDEAAGSAESGTASPEEAGRQIAMQFTW